MLAIDQGRVHALPSGLASMLATDVIGLGAKIDAARALVAVSRADAGGLRGVTWRAWTESVTRRPEVRAILDAFARLSTYANAPDRAAAGATIAQIRLAMDHGVIYVHDGWQTIVDALDRAARAAGVRITTGASVASIAPHDSGVAVTLADGATHLARAAILAVGPATARALLADDALGAGLVPSHAACLDVGLADLPRPTNLFALGLDRPTYYSVHSASARLNDGGATVHLMKYLPADRAPAGANGPEDERELEAMLDVLQPGWRDRVVTKRFLPRLVTSNGSALADAPRVALDAPKVPGVFLAGDWVESPSMLADAAIASARTAAYVALAWAARAGGAARVNQAAMLSAS
jgi:phytoene dehydrogenase-like protein